jgi:hypothetical protein
MTTWGRGFFEVERRKIGDRRTDNDWNRQRLEQATTGTGNDWNKQRQIQGSFTTFRMTTWGRDFFNVEVVWCGVSLF